jgi:hypothetical protein
MGGKMVEVRVMHENYYSSKLWVVVFSFQNLVAGKQSVR